MPDHEEAIQFEQIGIAKVLEHYAVEVPKYQRDYAWTESKVQTYLNDITSAIANDETQYFLGTIVTIKRGAARLEVVDGQQRLATTALVVAAMRHILKGQHPAFEAVLEKFLSQVDDETLENETRIKLNVADATVFRSLLLDGTVGGNFSEKRPSHVNLKNAYELAWAHLKKVGNFHELAQRIKEYQKWRNYLQNLTLVILMKVASDETAFKMFETLNDRGLGVSQADLIKNYLFGASAENVELAQQYWSSIRSILESIDDKNSAINFIWHTMIATQGSVELKKMYDKIKSKVAGKHSAISTLAEWEVMAQYYVALENPESAQWAGYPENFRRSIKILNLFDIQPFKPLLMASAKKMEMNKASEVFERVVAVGVRLIIASRTTTQSVFQALSDSAHKVWTGELKEPKGVVEFLAPNIPSDSVFKTAFETATVSNAKLARYYLRCLEQVKSGGAYPWLLPNEDVNVVNLEHILPQKPLDNWPKFSLEQANAYYKRIGNMALVSTKANSDAKSVSFLEKKHLFNEAPFLTTAMVGEATKWEMDSIDDRQKVLADLALLAWPLK